MSKEFLDAFADLKKEKNLSEEEIIGAIKDSIENAYRKNYGASNVRVDVDMSEGNVTVYMGMEVVEEVEDDLTQISIEDAKEIYDGYEIGDVVEYEIDPRARSRYSYRRTEKLSAPTPTTSSSKRKALSLPVKWRGSPTVQCSSLSEGLKDAFRRPSR